MTYVEEPVLDLEHKTRGLMPCALRQDKERQIKAVLVATKTDLPTQRHAVSLQAAQDWATANGMDFCSISSVSLFCREWRLGSPVSMELARRGDLLFVFLTQNL